MLVHEPHDCTTWLDRIVIVMLLIGTLILMGVDSVRMAGPGLG